MRKPRFVVVAFFSLLTAASARADEIAAPALIHFTHSGLGCRLTCVFGEYDLWVFRDGRAVLVSTPSSVSVRDEATRVRDGRLPPAARQQLAAALSQARVGFAESCDMFVPAPEGAVDLQQTARLTWYGQNRHRVIEFTEGEGNPCPDELSALYFVLAGLPNSVVAKEALTTGLERLPAAHAGESGTVIVR